MSATVSDETFVNETLAPTDAPGPIDTGHGPVQDELLTSPDADARSSSLWADAWRQLRRRPMFIISAIAVIILVLMAMFPSVFALGIDPREVAVGL